MTSILRNTQGELIAMKKAVLDSCIGKEMKCKDGAKLLQMHPNAFSRLKRHYLERGYQVLIPAKPGPKNHQAPNKTPEHIEAMVVKLGFEHSDFGPVPLAEALDDLYQVRLDPVTVWRILKRKRVRYTEQYQRIERTKPKLYCLDEPGAELQLDGSYPFGRARKIICFDAIDDCSRRAHSKLYEGTETTERAIDFVKELIEVSPFIIQQIRIDNRLGMRFDQYCENLDIKVVRNDPYEPTQNGKVERYHKTVKYKLFWMCFRYQDNLESLRYKLNLWLGYYNEHRRHGGYGMDRQTPNGKIASVLAKNLYNTFTLQGYPQKVTSTLQQYKA